VSTFSTLRHVALVAIVIGATFAPVFAQDSSAYPNRIRWGYYVTWDSTSLTTLRQQVHNLDIVSPYFYQVRSDRSIHTWSDPAAMQVMRESGVKIIPMITNAPRWDDFTDLMEDEDDRDEIVDKIVDLVETNDYDGIHIDFEAINASDADLVTDFMRRLSEELWPRDKMVTQAVIARVSDAPSVWGGAYDYAELAKYNDLIVIMAYDYTPVGSSTPGPVAPANWVSTVAHYTASRIPPDQVLLGVPFYGYDWTLNDEGTADEHAQAMRFDQTIALERFDDLEFFWDDQAQSPWATYTDDDDNEHEVWFENVDSLKPKLDIMINHDFAGMAAWRLGQEDPAVWYEIAQLSTPASRVAPVESTDERWYFHETGHTLSYGFLDYWLQNGGLPVFGFPQTEEFMELNADTMREHVVQYFERQRYEYHEEYAGTVYEVLLGRLGHEDALRRGLLEHEAFQPVEATDDPDCLYFDLTGQSVCGVFLEYWQSHGLNFGDPGISFRESLALFGYPISGEFTDPETGLTTQYFERAKFERHPEHAGTQYEVVLGQLGTEELREKGWIRK
jgi:spore germination protein YaaH